MTFLRCDGGRPALPRVRKAYKKMRAGSTPFTGWFCTWAGATLRYCDAWGIHAINRPN
jgi:hypothetical protein